MEIKYNELNDPAVDNTKPVGCFRPVDGEYSWYPGQLDNSLYHRNLHPVNMHFGVLYYLHFSNSETPSACIKWNSVCSPGVHPLEYARCDGYKLEMVAVLPLLIAGGVVNPVKTNITAPIVNLKFAELVGNNPVMLDIENDQPVLNIYDQYGVKIKTKIPLKWTQQIE